MYSPEDAIALYNQVIQHRFRTVIHSSRVSYSPLQGSSYKSLGEVRCSFTAEDGIIALERRHWICARPFLHI